MSNPNIQLTNTLTRLIKDYTKPFEDQIDALRRENLALETANQTSEQRRMMLQKLNATQKSRYEERIKLLTDGGEAPVVPEDAGVRQEIGRLRMDLGGARKFGWRCRLLEDREIKMRLEMEGKTAEIGRLREEVRRLRQGDGRGVRTTGEDRARAALVEMSTPQQSVAVTDADSRRRRDDEHASQLKTSSTTAYYKPRPGSERVHHQVEKVTDFVRRACEAVDTKPFTVVNLKARRGLYGRFEEVREELRRAVARCRLDVTSESEFNERVRLTTFLEAAMEEQL